MTPNDYLDFTDTTATATSKHLEHGIIGLANEAGGLLGLLKKSMFHDKQITNEAYADELGDCMWYIARALRGLNLTFEDLFDINATKLRKRYPNYYTKEAFEAKADYLTPELMRAGFNGA